MSAQATTKSYTNVLAALLILTIVTVGLSRVDLAWANIAVGVLVAIVKASLVVLFFMHLKYEARWWVGLVLFPVVLVLIIIFSNFPDTAFGQHTTPAVKNLHDKGGAPH